MSTLPPNPKQAYGDKKPNVALVPPALDLYAALALGDGAVKYGPYNWREKSVEVMTYVAAIMRHLGAWVDRQDLSEAETFTAPDGTVFQLGAKPQLAHVAACVAILADAVENGNAIDNRPPAGPSLKIQADWHGKLPAGKKPEEEPADGWYGKPEHRQIAEALEKAEPETWPKWMQAQAEAASGGIEKANQNMERFAHACPDLDQEFPSCVCTPLDRAECPGDEATVRGMTHRVACVKFLTQEAKKEVAEALRKARVDNGFDVVSNAHGY